MSFDIGAAEQAGKMAGGSLWIPDGVLERAAAKAVEDYDKDLILGQRRDTGEWIVFLRNGPEGPFPVLGLGNRLPSVDELQKKLYTSDTRRHGGKILQAIMRKQDATHKAIKDATDEKTGVMAEALDHGFRQQGVHPSPRVFIPRGVNISKED